jgi:subtilisin family serine protease
MWLVLLLEKIWKVKHLKIDFMKLLKILTIIFLVFYVFSAYAQDVQFYIQIEDNNLIPKVTKDKTSERLITNSKDFELNKLYSKFEIKKFEKAFPTAVTPSLNNVYHVICNSADLGEELRGKYKEKVPRLEFIEESVLTYDPNDNGLAAGQTNLDLINTKGAWDIIYGLPLIDIAISDNYFDLNHEDLNMSLFSGSNTIPSSYPQHGIFVAGMAAAITDNNKGIASVGFKTHLAVTTNRTDNQNLLLAQAGYRVINCSWTYGCTCNSFANTLYNEIRNVWNTLVVFGAGNAGTNHCGNSNPSYPASYATNIAVTSVGHLFNVGTTQSPVNNNWKNVHEEIIGDSLSAHKHHSTMDICAPGYNVNSTDLMGSAGKSSGNYTNDWGTSFAAPQIAAALGLIISINPCLSANQAAAILLDNADNSIYNIPQNQRYIGRLGSGRLDVNASVNAAAESATTYLDGVTLSGNQTIKDNYAIRAVNNVALTSTANINLITRKVVAIDKNFTVPVGAILSIDVNANNSVNCN